MPFYSPPHYLCRPLKAQTLIRDRVSLNNLVSKPMYRFSPNFQPGRNYYKYLSCPFFLPKLNMALQQHFTITYFAIKIQKLKMQFSVTYIITRKSLRSLLSFNDKKRLQQAFKLSHQVNPSDSSKYPREKHKIV